MSEHAHNGTCSRCGGTVAVWCDAAKERDSLLAVVGACEAIGVARQVEEGRWEVHNARAVEAEGERDAALEWQRIAEADRDRVTDRFVAVGKERDSIAAQLAQAREALSTVLGIGHSLRAFAGTMLRWNEPGVDFTDEAARIVALAEKFHATISAALSTPAPLPPVDHAAEARDLQRLLDAARASEQAQRERADGLFDDCREAARIAREFTLDTQTMGEMATELCRLVRMARERAEKAEKALQREEHKRIGVEIERNEWARHKVDAERRAEKAEARVGVLAARLVLMRKVIDRYVDMDGISDDEGEAIDTVDFDLEAK